MPAAATVRSAVLTVVLGAAAAALVACGEGVSPGAGSAPGGTASSSAPAAGSSTPARPSPGTPAVHRLGPRDTGKTVTLAVGDRLVVELSDNRLAARWTVADYPRGVLATDLAAGAVGGFAFLARGPGSGPLVFARASCGVAGTEPCPSNARVAATTCTVTVRVR